MKKILVLMFIIFSVSFAKTNDAKAYLVGDKDGNIYFSKNIKKKLPLASVTKIMTLMITYEDIEHNKIKLNDKIKIKKDIANIGGSRIWLKEDMKISLGDLMKASAIYSANNATQAIAWYVSHGNIDKFVKRMNKKLKDLNLDKEIRYYTPTGLPSDMTHKKMDVGSALGLYKLSIWAEKNSEYMKLASKKKAHIIVGNILNRNKLLGKEGIYGIKTGHHDQAGYNICIVSKINNFKLFVVILGSHAEKERDDLALTLINKFNQEYIYREVLDKNKSLTKVRVIGGKKEYVSLYPDKNLKKIFKKDDNINIKIKRESFVAAPVKLGEVIGSYEIRLNDKKILTGKLITKEKVKIYTPF